MSSAPFRAGVLALVLSAVIFHPPVLAASPKVKTIRSGGVMELDNGQRVTLAGIRLSSEALRLLPALVAGRGVDLEYDSLLPAPPTPEPRPVYAYVKAAEIDFPFSANRSPHEKNIMVNELLIMTGAAEVEAPLAFKWKDRFLAAQAEARRKGEGIWSYENGKGSL